MASPDVSYTFIELDHKRSREPQKYHVDSTKLTSEFLLVSLSHGNPSAEKKNRPTILENLISNWSFVGYAGNDDRSIEVWHRVNGVTNRAEWTMDTRHGKGAVAIIAFDGLISPVSVATVNHVDRGKVEIEHSSRHINLVIAASDMPIKSRKSEVDFGPSKDDRTLIYISDRKRFRDPSAGYMRGPIMSISLSKSIF
jgi:hypothetical protein